MFLATDDDVRRVKAVWLGPDEYTLPFHARYLAWVLWFVLELVTLAVLALVPGLSITFTTVLWSSCGIVLLTHFLMTRVDWDQPLGTVVTHYRRELTARPARDDVERPTRPLPRRVRIRTTTPDEDDSEPTQEEA